MAIYVLEEQYANAKKIIAICTSYKSAKKIAREWFEEEVAFLSTNQGIEAEFNIPESHELFFTTEDVYAEIEIRSTENSAKKSLFITAYASDQII